MDLPKFHETFVPILETLKDGQVMRRNDLSNLVAERYYSDLPLDLSMKKTSTGANVLLDRISWGSSYLKLAKFLCYPERGKVQITDKGKSVIEKGVLTYQEFIKDSDYLEHKANYRSKKQDSQQIDPEDNSISTENASPQDLIDTGFSEIEARVKSELLEKLKSIDAHYFERVLLKLFHQMGYGDFVETPKTRDGGIDGVINEDQLGLEKIYIQAKRYNENNIREKDIRNFIGAMSGDTNKGIFVTTSEFNDGAIKKAREAHHTIILIDGDKLVDLLHQYNVGVQVRNTYNMKEIDEDFFEQNL